MAYMDSADMLARVQREIGQPSTADFPQTSDIYAWLGEAQIEVFTRLAVYAPNAVRIPPRQMIQPAARTVACTLSSNTTVASSALFLLNDVDSAITGTGIPAGTVVTGFNSTSSIIVSQAATLTGAEMLTLTPDPAYVLTFGTDADGNNLYPVGAVQLWQTLNDQPDWPLQEGVDFICEGNKIRMADNTPWPYPTMPYYQCLVLPLTLSATVSPTLRPVQARQLIVDLACQKYGEDTGDGAMYEKRFEKHWNDWIGAIQTQYAAPFRAAATNPQALPGRQRFGYGYGYRFGYWR